MFLTHGEVPLTNNRCENAIRPFVLSRKGWLFADTVRGAVASANLYSLLEVRQSLEEEREVSEGLYAISLGSLHRVSKPSRLCCHGLCIFRRAAEFPGTHLR